MTPALLSLYFFLLTDLDPPTTSLPPGLPVDSTTFDTVIGALVNEGRMSTARSIYQLMVRSGFKQTVYTYAALVRMQRSSLGVYEVWAAARCVGSR